MKRIFLFSLICSVAFSCTTMNSTDMVNLVQNISDCLYIEDLNAMIVGYNQTVYVNETIYVNQTVYVNQTYPFLNQTIQLSGTFNNLERNISVFCAIPQLFSHALSAGQVYVDSLRNTSYSCANSTTINNTIYSNCSLPYESRELNPGECYNSTARNMSICAKNVTQNITPARVTPVISPGSCYDNPVNNVYVCAASCFQNSTLPEVDMVIDAGACYESFEGNYKICAASCPDYSPMNTSLYGGENRIVRNVTISCVLPPSVALSPIMPEAMQKSCNNSMLGWMCGDDLKSKGCTDYEVLNWKLNECWDRMNASYDSEYSQVVLDFNTSSSEKLQCQKDLSLSETQRETCENQAQLGLLPILIVVILFLGVMVIFRVYNVQMPNLDRFTSVPRFIQKKERKFKNLFREGGER